MSAEVGAKTRFVRPSPRFIRDGKLSDLVLHLQPILPLNRFHLIFEP